MPIRPATEADLGELVSVQEAASVAALAHVFPQDSHPFPRDEVTSRWRSELRAPGIAVYVSTAAGGGVDGVNGFAARTGDELLHFGVAPTAWGTGVAGVLHDELVATFPRELDRLVLRVFEENHRARRFWSKHGWEPTGRSSRSTFAPHPVLLEYELHLAGP